MTPGLLPQPGGFEGFSFARAGVPKDRLPSAPLGHLPGSLPAEAYPRNRHVSKVTHLTYRRAEARGDSEQFFPEAPDTIVTKVGGNARQRHVERDELRLGVDEGDEGIEIAPVEGFVRPVHHLHVLLRHRLLREPRGFE